MPESFEIENGKKPAAPEAESMSRYEKFSGDSTCSAILYMFNKEDYSTAIRIFWGVVVLIAVALFSAVTIYDFFLLAREPISTSITLTREDELQFPAVTICSLSFLNTSALDSVSTDTIDVRQRVRELFDVAEPSQACTDLADQLADDTDRDVSFGELTSLARNVLSTLIEECTFVGNECTANDFEAIQTVGGVCYTFNGQSTQQTRTVKGVGVRRGLHLVLSAEFQLFSLNDDRGFRVVIHNPDELPRPESQGISVPLDHAVYIGMRQVNSEDKTLFSSGHRCRGEGYADRELNIPAENPYLTYSPTVCQSECFYTSVADRCGCKEPNLYTPVAGSRFNQLRDCELEDICCEVPAFEEVEESCDCPPKCETVERTTTISYSSSEESDRVVVNAFFESLILETRETTDSYTIWGLVSDVGGNTGLFLGFTLLTGVEFLVFMGMICCGRRRKNGKQK